MNRSLVEMLEYNEWANRELFEACVPLGDDELDAHAPGVSGSVRELLLHIAGGQQTFILRTKGRQHEGELTRLSEWPGYDSLLATVADTDAELIAIARELDDAELIDLPYEGETYRFPKRFFLVHAIEHSAEHRTEVKVALNSLGVKTPDLDGWFYATSKGYGQKI